MRTNLQELPVSEVHNKIEEVILLDGLESVMRSVAEWDKVGISLNARVSNQEWGVSCRAFENQMFQELDTKQRKPEYLKKAIAETYAKELISSAGLDNFRGSYKTLLRRWMELFAAIAEVWHPILHRFVKGCLEEIEGEHLYRVYFLARDSIPFYCMALALQGPPYSFERHLIVITRDMVERLEKTGANGKKQIDVEGAQKILARAGVKPDITDAIIDAGFYGTIIKDLWETWTRNCHVYLFASRNPNIQGYLTSIAQVVNHGVSKLRIPWVQLVVWGDSIEVLPKPYRKPRTGVYEGEEQQTCSLTDLLSLFGAFALYWKLYHLAKSKDLLVSGKKAIDQMINFYFWYQKRKRGVVVPFCLTERLPTWEKAETHLTGWDKGPVRPMDVRCGHKTG